MVNMKKYSWLIIYFFRPEAKQTEVTSRLIEEIENKYVDYQRLSIKVIIENQELGELSRIYEISDGIKTSKEDTIDLYDSPSMIAKLSEFFAADDHERISIIINSHSAGLAFSGTSGFGNMEFLKYWSNKYFKKNFFQTHFKSNFNQIPPLSEGQLEIIRELMASTNKLYIFDFAIILTTALENRKIDLLIANACYFAMFDNLYALADTVRYVVAPQLQIGISSFDTNKFFSYLNTTADENILCAKKAVEIYVETGELTNQKNITAFDCGKVYEVNKRLNNFIGALCKRISWRSEIDDFVNQIDLDHFSVMTGSVDIAYFADTLQQQLSNKKEYNLVRLHLSNIKTSYRDCVLISKASADLGDLVTGLNIYFPNFRIELNGEIVFERNSLLGMAMYKTLAKSKLSKSIKWDNFILDIFFPKTT